MPTTTNVLVINNGKIVFTRSNNNQQPGLVWCFLFPVLGITNKRFLVSTLVFISNFNLGSGLKGDPRPSFSLIENPAARDCQSEYADSEVGSEISSCFEPIQSYKLDGSKSEILSVVREEGKRISSRSISLFSGENNMEFKPGWPLLLRTCSETPQAKHARSMSVVKWVMNLPSRNSPYHTPRCSTIKENPLEIQLSGSEDDIIDSTNSSMLYELQKCLEIVLKTNPSDCRWFTYKALKAATAQFSSGSYPLLAFRPENWCIHTLSRVIHTKNRVSCQCWTNSCHFVFVISVFLLCLFLPLLFALLATTDIFFLQFLLVKTLFHSREPDWKRREQPCL